MHCFFHQAQADACSWEQKLQQAEQNYMAENVKIRTDLTTRLERITKQYEAANKDKESMVIKYATSEREVKLQLVNNLHNEGCSTPALLKTFCVILFLLSDSKYSKKFCVYIGIAIISCYNKTMLPIFGIFFSVSP